MSSQSTPDLLTVVSNRIAGAFNKSGATQAVALYMSKAFKRVWHSGLLHELRLVEFQVRYLVLSLYFSVLGGFRWFKMGSLQKNIQLMLEFLRVHFWSYTFPTIH